MSDFTPPPRRPAPEELRRRIAADLAHAEGGASRRRRVLVGVAAALVLVAGAAGVLGSGRLDGHTDLVPVDRPTPTETSSIPAPSVSPSPGPRPTSARPETLSGLPMTSAQIQRDTTSCLETDVTDSDPPPRQGTMRTTYAFVQPVVTNETTPLSQRVLFLQDDVGQFTCVDGQEVGWSSLPSGSFAPTATVPGGEVPNTGGSTSASCGTVAKSEVESSVLLQVDQKRVAAAEVTLISDRRAVRVVDVPVDGPRLYLAVRLAGAAARLPMSFRVELHDDQGHVLAVQPYGAAGTKPANRLTFVMESCTEAKARVDAHRPNPLTRPSSDRAGIATCLKLVRADGDQPLDLDRAKAEVTISTATEWGAVVSDGSHYLGCSLYPTKEISAAEPVTSSPPTTKAAFSWATNPIPDGGESLWAAGYLPGVTTITYQLPNGTSAAATISPDGYWLVKARTATVFDSEDNAADWEPVRVTVTRDSRTSTYDIAWTEETQCHQVSHGC